MAPIVRVAVVQAASVAFELEPTLDRAAELTARAASDGARLVVFPEAFIGGYPKGADFGVRVGQRSPAGRDWYRRYAGSAIEVPSAETDRLGLIARENDAYVVMGVIEREGGTLYCTVLFLGPDGTLLGKHRKLMPTAMERVIWGEGDGSTLPVLETPLGRIGAVICWENYMPLLRTAMYAKGIQLYCVPTADARETWLPTIRLIAMEGRCFVLSACQFTRRRDYPDDYDCVDSEGRPARDPDTVLMGGRSCIVGPLGEVIAGPASDGEAILCADLDLDEILRGTLDFDPVGHYSRPDIFTLTVDERPHLGVRSIRGAGEVASAGRDGESGGVRDVASAGG